MKEHGKDEVKNWGCHIPWMIPLVGVQDDQAIHIPWMIPLVGVQYELNLLNDQSVLFLVMLYYFF
jgi:hypothetical protein